MTTLAVTRSLVSNTNPTEGQFDTMRTDLLTFFNTTGLAANNIAAGGMTYTSLDMDILDDTTIKWTSDDAIMKYDSGNNRIIIQNTEGDIRIGLKSGSTYTDYLNLDSATGLLSLKGVPVFNTGTGSQAVDLMWLLSRYRKPRLVYSTDDIITIEANGPDGNTYVMGRDRLWKVYDTTCSLAVNANGETTGDTGTAVSGLGAGVTRTANKWYYLYAVEVQFGTQADGIQCILVANETPPLTGNITTLNTAFGAGKWLYIGCIRNGYNDGTNTNIILPFNVEENGYTMFTKGTAAMGNEGRGMNLTSATGTTTNLVYTLDLVNNDADSIPPVATRGVFTGYRSGYGFEFHYQEASSNESHAIITNGHHPASSSSLIGVLYLEVPLISAYELIVVAGSVATNKRICLAGFMDQFL